MIGALLGCTSTTMIQFSVAILIDAMAGYETEIICVAFVGKFLPQRTAAYYYGLIASLATGVSVLAGIIIAGELASYTSMTYRTVLYFAFAVSLLRWLYILFFIRKQQSSLMKDQLAFVEYYQRQTTEKAAAAESQSQMQNSSFVFLACFFPFCFRVNF
jgi:MFS family permease